MSQALFTGIDIGADSVKVVSLRRRGSSYRVLGAGMAHTPAQLGDGPAAVAAVAQTVKRLIRTQRIPLGRTVVGLSGRGSLMRYLMVPAVPPWKLAMLMNYEVEEQAGSDIAFAYHVLQVPEIEEGQFSVMLAQAQADVVNERLALCRQAVRRADEVDMQASAVHNLFAMSPACDEDTVSLVLDVGAEETNVTVQRGSAFYFARALSGGGRRFTARIQNEFDLTFEAAEAMKVESEGILPEPGAGDLIDEEAHRLSKACRAEAVALASAVQSSLSFFRGQLAKGAGAGARDKLDFCEPAQMHITGGGSQLKGLDAVLAQRLRLPVETLDVGAALPVRQGSAELALAEGLAPHFATALGLALGRARAQGLRLNLLPEAEKERRQFWDRTAYLVGGAVVGVVMLVFACLVSFRDLATARKLDEAKRQALAGAKAAKEEFDAAVGRNRRLAQMVAALEERGSAGPDVLSFIQLLREELDRLPIERVGMVLKKGVKPEVFVIGIKTVNLVEAEARAPTTASSGRRRRRPKPDDGPLVAAAAGRHLVVEGFCMAPDESAGSSLVEILVDHLRSLESELLDEVSWEYYRWHDTGDDLKPYFQGTNELRPVANPGTGIFFRLDCTIRTGSE